MKILRRLMFGFIVVTSALAWLRAAETKADHAGVPGSVKGKLVPAKELDGAWLAKARKEYPLNGCLWADEKFADPADIADFAYREPGKADRLVRFCCAGCGDDFLKEADKCLAKLDAAAKRKVGATKEAKERQEHHN